VVRRPAPELGGGRDRSGELDPPAFPLVVRLGHFVTGFVSAFYQILASYLKGVGGSASYGTPVKGFTYNELEFRNKNSNPVL
jgi:hypothetical protein